MVKYLLIVSVLLCSIVSKAQFLGTQGIFKFIDLSPTARLTALGGTNVSLIGNDGALAYDNPAILSDASNSHLSFQQRFYFTDIKASFVSYSFRIKKLKKFNFNASLNHMNYGDFKLSDVYGTVLGAFNASETAFSLGGSYQVYERLRVGTNLRYITSRFESYASHGVLLDLGGLYQIKEKNLTIGLVFKNIGTQISKYDNEKENINKDVQLGLTKRLKHLPLSFSVTLHHLNQWNILYDDPNSVDDFILFNETPKDTRVKDFVDNTFRHFIFAGEFLIGKKEGFKIRLSYNHLRRSELSVKNFRSLAGFAGGIGIRLKKVYLDFSFSSYHLAGSAQHIGISTNLSDWKGTKNWGL